ncbi:putative ankyrin repeat protein RF_0381 [Haliotis asinina]|uniref:putative ankyrin repeat protein RF_0381 n=1 Tax=Haliotis asinina TaxID=109174 RepID=UPI003531F5AF
MSCESTAEDSSESSSPPFSSFMDAVNKDDHVRVQEVIEEGLDVVSWRDSEGQSATVLACQSNAGCVLNLLISAGCSLQEEDNRGCSLLEVAVERGFLDIVRILHDSGFDFNVTLSKSIGDQDALFNGGTIGDLAVNKLIGGCQIHRCDILDFFHKNDVALPTRSRKGTTLVDELLSHKICCRTLAKLIKSGHHITLQSPVQYIPFLHSPDSLLKDLVSQGYSINKASDGDPCPPLFYVCSGLRQGWEDDSFPTLELFLHHGADVNVKCKSNIKRNRHLPHQTWNLGAGLTALHIATVSNSESYKSDLVYLLCQHGADVNAQTESGDTPLLLAIKGLHCTDVDYLHGIHKDKEVDTYAVQILLQYGARPDIPNKCGETCLNVIFTPGMFDNDKVKLMLIDSCVHHTHLPNLETITIPGFPPESLQAVITNPRRLSALARACIHESTRGRHMTEENGLDFLPTSVLDYITMEYFSDASWVKDPWSVL